MTAMPPRLSPPPPARWKWTREQYHEMGRLGFFRGKRVELIDGEVRPMSPMNDPHGLAVVFTSEALRLLFGEQFTHRVQLPMRLWNGDEPEPDVAVIAGPPRSHTGHPPTAVLVVEIADTSFEFDTHEKAGLYAAAGVPEYWVLDLERRRLLVFRGPKPAASEPFGHRYESLLSLDPDQKLSPLAAPDASVKVADLLP
ncbi:MAG: Uma2 family endonuclease [Gemmataceae bacterium]